MGPYCNFCGTRCFIPTSENDIIKKDLKATCKDGIAFDLSRVNKLIHISECLPDQETKDCIEALRIIACNPIDKKLLKQELLKKYSYYTIKLAKKIIKERG